MRRLLASTAVLALLSTPALALDGHAADDAHEAEAHEAGAHAAADMSEALGVPSGLYVLDKNHASLTWSVMHLGLSHYTARFTAFDVALNFDAADPTQSTLTATIDPASVRTDYPGDYKATHADSEYETWDEDLARNPGWMNADAFPEITFTSTEVTMDSDTTGTVTGDVTFLGVTAPVTLDVTLIGTANPKPRSDFAALGFSAHGTLDRTAFGNDTAAPFIGEEVKLRIEAEFHHEAEAEADTDADAGE